jgi:hypothetical protein
MAGKRKTTSTFALQQEVTQTRRELTNSRAQLQQRAKEVSGMRARVAAWEEAAAEWSAERADFKKGGMEGRAVQEAVEEAAAEAEEQIAALRVEVKDARQRVASTMAAKATLDAKFQQKWATEKALHEQLARLRHTQVVQNQEVALLRRELAKRGGVISELTQAVAHMKSDLWISYVDAPKELQAVVPEHVHGADAAQTQQLSPDGALRPRRPASVLPDLYAVPEGYHADCTESTGAPDWHYARGRRRVSPQHQLPKRLLEDPGNVGQHRVTSPDTQRYGKASIEQVHSMRSSSEENPHSYSRQLQQDRLVPVQSASPSQRMNQTMPLPRVIAPQTSQTMPLPMVNANVVDAYICNTRGLLNKFGNRRAGSLSPTRMARTQAGGVHLGDTPNVSYPVGERHAPLGQGATTGKVRAISRCVGEGGGGVSYLQEARRQLVSAADGRLNTKALPKNYRSKGKNHGMGNSHGARLARERVKALEAERNASWSVWGQ